MIAFRVNANVMTLHTTTHTHTYKRHSHFCTPSSSTRGSNVCSNSLQHEPGQSNGWVAVLPVACGHTREESACAAALVATDCATSLLSCASPPPPRKLLYTCSQQKKLSTAEGAVNNKGQLSYTLDLCWQPDANCNSQCTCNV